MFIYLQSKTITIIQMKKYKDRSMSTKLMTNTRRDSYKLIIKYGDNINIKIFDGQNAYERAKYFQDNVVDLMRMIR